MSEIAGVRLDTLEIWFPFFRTSEHTRSLGCEAQKWPALQTPALPVRSALY